MDEKSIAYLGQYIKVTSEVRKKIERHAKRYGIEAEICAWYNDWDDFCSDWEEAGYSRTEARRLLHNGKGEFMTLPDGLGIVRFSL